MSQTATDGEQQASAGGVYVTNLPQSVPEAFWLADPRELFVVADVALVPLTQGQVAIIDAADAWRVEGSNWYFHGGRYAAIRPTLDGVRCIVYMHQVIAEPGRGLDVDHINGDGLDNRRCNLREATRQQNLANRRAHRNNKTGIKGVWRHGLKWRASIQVDGKTRHLGGFDTPEDAGRAYEAAARALHGDFAR